MGVTGADDRWVGQLKRNTDRRGRPAGKYACVRGLMCREVGAAGVNS